MGIKFFSTKNKKMRFKEKILGLLISQQERIDLASGSMRVIKRKMNPQPSENWMDNVLTNFPDLKMYDDKLRQRFWIHNHYATVDKKGKDTSEISPKYAAGTTIWGQYTYRKSVAAGSDHKKHIVNKKRTSTSSSSSSVNTTEIYLYVKQVIVEKIKGEWYWLYMVELIEKPKYLNN